MDLPDRSLSETYPLMVAIENDDSGLMVRALMDSTLVNLDRQDFNNTSIFDYALRNGNFELCDELYGLAINQDHYYTIDVPQEWLNMVENLEWAFEEAEDDEVQELEPEILDALFNEEFHHEEYLDDAILEELNEPF